VSRQVGRVGDLSALVGVGEVDNGLGVAMAALLRSVRQGDVQVRRAEESVAPSPAAGVVTAQVKQAAVDRRAATRLAADADHLEPGQAAVGHLESRLVPPAESAHLVGTGLLFVAHIEYLFSRIG
jgi:hypothetical protein